MAGMFSGATSFDQSLAGWDVSSITSLHNTFNNGSKLSTVNYDTTLISWAQQTVQPDVFFMAGDSYYCRGDEARSNLFNQSQWHIYDLGKQCPRVEAPDLNVVPHGVYVELNWDDVEHADRYTLQYKRSSDGTWSNYVDVFGSSSFLEESHSFVRLLDRNTSYDFRVNTQPIHPGVYWDDADSDWSTATVTTTSQQTYHIADCKQLQGIMINPETLVLGDPEGHYILDNDIDCSASNSWMWVDLVLGNTNPIGFMGIYDMRNDYSAFTGTFDGQGHTVSNIYQDVRETGKPGVFASIHGATIENTVFNASTMIGITNISAPSSIPSPAASGLVGLAWDSSISNVHLAGLDLLVPNRGVSGGLIASAAGEVTIDGSSVQGEISTFTANVGSTGFNIAGLVGVSVPNNYIHNQQLSISRTYTNLSMSAVSPGNVEGAGMSSMAGYAELVNIENSYTTGSLSIDGDNSDSIIYGAGLVSAAGRSNISKSYSDSNIAITNIGSSGIAIAGGLIALVQGSTAVTNSFASGSVMAPEPSGTPFPLKSGGLIGTAMMFDQVNNPTVIMGNYYDKTATGQTNCVGVFIDMDTMSQTSAPGGTSCNEVNADGTDAMYFKYNTVNPPLNSWDFVNIWKPNTDIPPDFIGSSLGSAVTIPTAPRQLAVTETNVTAITIGWLPPADDGGSPVTHYKVQYKPSGHQNWINAPVQVSNVTTHAFTEMVPATNYDFRVAAINQVGMGPYTMPVTGATLPTASPTQNTPSSPQTSTVPTTRRTPQLPRTPTTNVATNSPEPATPELKENHKLSTENLDNVTLPKPQDTKVSWLDKTMPYIFISLLLLVALAYALRGWKEYRRMQEAKRVIREYETLGASTYTFLSIISHYLNTPVTILQSAMELISSRGSIASNVLEHIQHQIKDLALFTSELQSTTQSQISQVNKEATNENDEPLDLRSISAQQTWLPLMTVAAAVTIFDVILIINDAYRRSSGLRLINISIFFVAITLLAILIIHTRKRGKALHLQQDALVSQQANLFDAKTRLLDMTATRLSEHYTTLTTSSASIKTSPEASKPYINGLRMLGKLTDSLSFAATHANAGRLLATSDLLSTVGPSVEKYAEIASAKRVTIQNSIPPSLTVKASPEHVCFITESLLDNAVKFSPEGKSIMLTASRRGKNITLLVADDGPGLSAQAQAKLFEPFNHGTTVTTYDIEGLGMGLYNARFLVDMLGGSLQLKTGAAKGLIAEVMLPLGKGVVKQIVAPARPTT